MKTLDQVKPLAQDSNEVRLTLSDEDLKVLREIKDLLAHQYPNASLRELVGVALVEARTAIQNKKAGKSVKARSAAKEPSGSEAANLRTPSALLKRQGYERARGQCEICGSRHATE